MVKRMVEIKLDKEYYLTTDPLNWRIGKYIIRTHKDGYTREFISEGYFSSISSALQYYFDLQCRALESTSFGELVQDIEKVKQKLSEAIPNLKIVVD